MRPGRPHKSGMTRLLLLLLTLASSCRCCPDKCLCSSDTVKCQNQDLVEIPASLPANTKFLFVTGNTIAQISDSSFPTRLENLTEMYLSGNKMEEVHAGAFKNLPSLVRLDLSSNAIQNFSERAFPDGGKLQVLNLSRSLNNYTTLDFFPHANLPNLTSLDLSNNDLLFLPDGMFQGLPGLATLNLRNSSLIMFQSVENGALPALRDLDLRDNELKDLSAATTADFGLRLDLRVQLAGNPWRCKCFISDLLAWLKKNSTQEVVVDVHELTCADPEPLRHQPLLQVEQSQLKCSNDMERVLETSYVFLGLVLALIGVIFLLVLYLNRKGIKRWMYNIRDACRDHMEGYHYRYEINSDPRLANLSINSDV
ncbi:trophoblast glycoprotein b [Poeciliopsis prolifica]|uniref:trophoblast glycoprotein b n=1 Tax=Poeciliopsis prolifica TaxID=188132 RepID=UPI0024138CFD|nr:trophoblast glycoprotein b [Poeciliopsis prolifica]